MTKIDVERVKLVHQLIAQETGGDPGLRDEGLLEAALESAYASFEGKEFYPTKVEKAAKIGYDLISNHAFIDGNKRIGMHIMLAFLEANSMPVEATNEDVARVGLSVASGTLTYEQLLAWLREHVR